MKPENYESHSGPEPLTDREFQLFQKLIYEKIGVYLSPVKKTLVSGRLSKRLRQLNLSNYKQYWEIVEKEENVAERDIFIDAITTNETHFFREPKHFTYLEETLFPYWEKQALAGARTRTIKIWSAACSTGEEPFSIAMSFLKYFPRDSGWNIEILASDISNEVLTKASQGLWKISRAEEIPENLLKQFMLRGKGAQQGKMKASNELRNLISFKRINLNHSDYPVPKNIDVIFCRNVLIYFDAESRSRVVNNLRRYLASDGHLFLGHAESLSGIDIDLKSVIPAVYTVPNSGILKEPR